MHAFCASGKESVHACSYYSRCSELGVYSIKIKAAKAVRALVIRHYIFSCTSKLGSQRVKANLNKVGLTAPRLGIVATDWKVVFLNIPGVVQAPLEAFNTRYRRKTHVLLAT